MKKPILRFPARDIPYWASRYEINQLETRIRDVIVPRVKARGCLLRQEFLAICLWKTPRSQVACASNPSDYIESVTRVALSTKSERLRIEALTLLDGVGWPTASVILHWFHRGRYPILDFRALWSIGQKQPKRYDFEIWHNYTHFCRRLSRKQDTDMRTLDRALWQYSNERQS